MAWPRLVCCVTGTRHAPGCTTHCERKVRRNYAGPEAESGDGCDASMAISP